MFHLSEPGHVRADTDNKKQEERETREHGGKKKRNFFRGKRRGAETKSLSGKREEGTERASVREGGWRVTEGRERWRDGGRKRNRRDGKEGWVRRGRDGCGGWGRDGRRDGRRNVTEDKIHV